MGLFQPEVEYTYQLELEAGMIPMPSDSEVGSFVMYSVLLKEGLFKPNSAVVKVRFPC